MSAAPGFSPRMSARVEGTSGVADLAGTHHQLSGDTADQVIGQAMGLAASTARALGRAVDIELTTPGGTNLWLVHPDGRRELAPAEAPSAQTPSRPFDPGIVRRVPGGRAVGEDDDESRGDDRGDDEMRDAAPAAVPSPPAPQADGEDEAGPSPRRRRKDPEQPSYPRPEPPTPPGRETEREPERERAPAPLPGREPKPEPLPGPRPAEHPPSVEPAATPRPTPELTRRELRARSLLTDTRREAPAEGGWRAALSKVGVKISPSRSELDRRADERTVAQHWPGPRTIAIVNGKGGANKTPTTILLAAVLARWGGSGVLAWDNNPTRGTLGWRTEQAAHEHHVLDLLPRTEALLAPDARTAELATWVHHQREDLYDVLRSNPNALASDQRITAEDFDALHRVATKYFRLVLVDSGNDESDAAWLRMIDHTDQLVVATSTREEHAESGRLLLDELSRRDERSAQLADSAVVIVSHATTTDPAPAHLTDALAQVTRAAVSIPYDPAMGGRPLTYGSLRPATRRAWLRAAAVVAQGL